MFFLLKFEFLPHQVDDDLPLSVGVDGSLRAAVEDVAGADVPAVLVVVLGVGVAAG